MTRLAKELGADGALIIVPYYNKPTDEGVLRHFSESVSLNFLTLPIIIPADAALSLM